MPNQNLSNLSKDELKERLEKIRADRRASYAPTKSRTRRVNPMFADLPADIAAKILAELAAGLKEEI